MAKHEEQLAQVSDWFERDCAAKRPIQDELEEYWKLYNGDHWSLKDPLGFPLRTERQKQSRPNAVENYVFALIEGLVAEFSEDVDIVDYPVEEGDDDAALVMTNLKKHIFYKNRISQHREQYARNFFLYGTSIWHTIWDPTWKGGRGKNKWYGDIRVLNLHPQIVFPDARCRIDIEEGQRIHKAFHKTTEYIEQKFNVEVNEEHLANDMFLGENEDYRFRSSDDTETLLIETWYKGKPLFKSKDDEHGDEYGLHVVWWAGTTNPQYLHHENHVYYEPEEDCKFPFIFRNRYPRENSVWGFGEAHFLKSPQIALNKTAELILEGHMHFSLGQTFYRPGAISPKQELFLRQFGTLPNMYFAVNNLDDIKRINGRGVDPSLAQETSRLQRTMEGIIGRHDISQGRTPGSVVAFRALDLLAAKARIRLVSAENAILTAYEDVGNYVNHLITRFYTETRAYRILGEDAEKTEYVLVNEETGEEYPFLGEAPPGYYVDTKKVSQIKYGMFKPEEIMKVYIVDTQTGWEDTVAYDEEIAQAIDMYEMMSEDPDVGEHFTAEYEVYSPEFDTRCRISTSAPTDRAFYMEMGKELLMHQLIDEETFYYILQHGKFPPYESIVQKKKKEMMSHATISQEMQMKEMMQQQQAQEQQAQQQPQMPPDMGVPPQGEGGAPPMETPDAMLQEIFAARPDLHDQYMMLPPEEQQQMINEILGGAI